MSRINISFIDEVSTNTNRYKMTNVDTNETTIVDLSRYANITQYGSRLDARNLNEIVNTVNKMILYTFHCSFSFDDSSDGTYYHGYFVFSILTTRDDVSTDAIGFITTIIPPNTLFMCNGIMHDDNTTGNNILTMFTTTTTGLKMAYGYDLTKGEPYEVKIPAQAISVDRMNTIGF